jgi:alpha-methylacyl-CoA racemase
MTELLAEIFASRPRDYWTEAFTGRDACVTPVLTFAEATDHPHNTARGTYFAPDGLLQPAPAPRFLGTPPDIPHPAALTGSHTTEILTELGLTPAALSALQTAGAIGHASSATGTP